MNFKSALLAAAAAAAATTAQAADLPVAAEPVDYVKVCDAYGAQFYYIPGTDTCLRVGGRVRVQYTSGDLTDAGTDADYAAYGKGYLYLDARTATEFGLLRAFTELNGSSTAGFGLGSAYIQFGGFTFGYATSQFDIYTGQTLAGVMGRNWSDVTNEQLTYAASFGNGLKATIGLENGTRRETGSYLAADMPDLVATLGVSQGWGSAKLSGALHDVNTATVEELGWAVAGGVTFDLPMLGAGSNVFFQAQYADGALSYIGAGSTLSDVEAGDTVSGYSLSAGLYHQATATVGLALDGSYMDIDNAADYSRYAIDASAAWTPVKGFVMGVDAGYANVETNGADTDSAKVAFRVQRTF